MSICKLMMIGRWYEPRFVFFCQLVVVIREADANETSGEDGLALPGSLVGESQLRIPKLEADIIFSTEGDQLVYSPNSLLQILFLHNSHSGQC